MGSPDFSTIVVLAALAALLLVAIGYGQLVWLQRRARASAGAQEPSGSPFVSLLFWGSLIASAICFLHAVTSRVMPEQDAQLFGEELFSIAPRPGLVATYETRSNQVRKDDVLIRFSGRDGEEGQLAIKSRKQILQGDLEIEKARPIEFDPALLRRLDTAKAALQERTARQKQVQSERDSIQREAQQQRLNVDNRRFRAEQDLRTAERELAPLKASLETAKSELDSQETLLHQGLLSRMEVARQRDKVTDLEGQISEREGRISLFHRELDEVAALGGQAEKTYAGQGAARAQESTQLTADIAEAQQAVAAAAQMLEQDRPRAEAQRQKRIQQIEVQLAECDALLSGNGKKAQVEAPFDGRVGFREPSPSSPPSDNGPLLVLYKPGRITATLHLDDPAESEEAKSDLGADVIFGPEIAGRERTIGGEVVSKTEARGETEVVVACDPPERAVRAIAMGGAVPVRVRLKRGVAGSLGFRAGLALGALALLLAAFRSLWSRFRISRVPDASAPPGQPPPASSSGGFNPYGGGPERGMPGVAAAGYSPYASRPGDYPAPPPIPAPAARVLSLPPAWPVDGAAPYGTPFLRPPGDDLAADERDPLYLRRLGARLRLDVEGASLSPALVRRVHQLIGRGGFHSSALVMSGFGAGVDQRHLARAAFDLHLRTFESPPPTGGLGPAARSCAEFLQVMRAVGADHLSGAIDSVRTELIAATLAAAERDGSSSESAGSLVKPLMEV